MNIVVFTHVPMKLNNLKIYCQTEEDQTNIVEFIFSQYEDVEVSTWEPDPVDTGTWGMFVDEFPPELWGKLEQYLESEDSWELDEEVEMELECEEPRVTKSYP
jgi:hypothetical protein